MKILAFDTNSSGFSVALASRNKILSKSTILESGKQSEWLILEIEKLLKQNQIWYQDLGLIAATNGPGSFTGTRIGLTAARTIRIATGLPLVFVNCCEVIAYKYRHQSKRIFTLLDAKAGDFFYAENGSKPSLVKLVDLLKVLPKEEFFLCGSGKKIAAEILQKENLKFEMSDEDDEAEADSVALLAYEKMQLGESFKENLDPIYLRSPRISKRKK